VAGYKQYTECIEAADWSPMNRWIKFAIQSMLTGGTGALIAIARHARWECWLIVGEITLLAFMIAYCRHFLYHRLICLGGDRDAVGMLVSIEDPSPWPELWDPDTDYCINLLLCDNPPGVIQAKAEQRDPYGFLIAGQPGPASRGLQTAGETATDKITGEESAVLHVEFEGAGPYDWLLASEIAFFAAVFALAACVVPIPGMGVVAAILAGLAFLIWMIGTTVGLFDEGRPSDVEGAPSVLHTNHDPNGGAGAGADILYVKGTWVYDTLHDGWNELHPVKVCTKQGTWDGDWEGTRYCSAPILLRLREAFEDAESDETRANQQLPEHGWRVHPDLDGCEPEIIVT
jgi:Na+-transporting methylmalonyl-CoA/oxaloacetate decarboxylase gamma subunit